MASAYFLSGYLLRRIKAERWFNLWNATFLFAIVAVAVALADHSLGMNEAQGGVTIIYYLFSMVGSVAVLCLSKRISTTRAAGALTYIGDKTLYILTFHLLSFEAVSYICVLVNGYSVDRLSDWPVIYGLTRAWWVAYSVVGIVFPLIIWRAFHHLPHKLLRSDKPI